MSRYLYTWKKDTHPFNEGVVDIDGNTRNKRRAVIKN